MLSSKKLSSAETSRAHHLARPGTKDATLSAVGVGTCPNAVPTHKVTSPLAVVASA